MSLITPFLNQTAMWQAKTAENKYSEPEYAEAVFIKCRSQGHGVLYHTNTGDTKMSRNVYYCEGSSKVAIGDLLDGFIVLEVQSLVAFDGTVVGLKVLV